MTNRMKSKVSQAGQGIVEFALALAIIVIIAVILGNVVLGIYTMAGVPHP